MFRVTRPVLRQNFRPFTLTVKVSPTPLYGAGSLQALYSTIVLKVPKASGTVYLGDASIDATQKNGIELAPGDFAVLAIETTRQLYEVQSPLSYIQTLLVNFWRNLYGAGPDSPADPAPEAIPYVSWDVANIFLTAPVQTTIGGWLLEEMYK